MFVFEDDTNHSVFAIILYMIHHHLYYTVSREYLRVTYCCVLQFEPLLQPNTSERVHHILIYKCHDLTNSTAANTSDFCDDIHPEADLCRLNLLIGGWAVGAGVRIYTHTHIMYACIYIFTCVPCAFTVAWQLMLLYAYNVCMCTCHGKFIACVV